MFFFYMWLSLPLGFAVYFITKKLTYRPPEVPRVVERKPEPRKKTRAELIEEMLEEQNEIIRVLEKKGLDFDAELIKRASEGRLADVLGGKGLDGT